MQNIMLHDKSELIKYRLERADQTLKEAKDAFMMDNLFNTENRIYYAGFYAVSALALLSDFSTTKHKQLLGWFNQNFIKTEKIPLNYGKIYQNAFNQRQEADYDDFIVLEKELVHQELKDMIDFVNIIKNYINFNQ